MNEDILGRIEVAFPQLWTSWLFELHCEVYDWQRAPGLELDQVQYREPSPEDELEWKLEVLRAQLTA